ncbi:TIM-barrel domain-containing protein [Solilutibacter silvestris]|uniref:Glycosyl hydrolase family 31 n=1 Tax=Solilutibacter silvestris TaxID=1645665 RepID=A0A2K1Q1V3_9GAMM|nr:TIM-barrel domain-containing protein [Lysobacter silvestris]PNS09020.1 Glycosyl hydrolase family 31 [Lysobacter silvestris]
MPQTNAALRGSKLSNRLPRRNGLVVALAASLLALTGSACAASVGDLRTIAPVATNDATAPAWEITTASGSRLRIDVLRADTIRVQAGRNGVLTPSGDKATPIVVLSQPASKVNATLEQDASEIRIRTDALVLHVQRQPLRLSLERIDGGKTVPLWHELQPLDLAKEQSVQTLSSDAGEHFFGGGQQNGRFEFKGRELPISYSGGWEEGDRPSPAPMLLSSHGWGMLRNTWSDGTYDLRQAESSTLLHREDRFDAYYFVGATLHDLLDRYTALTGRAKMLPRWALSYGDADCYNDGDNKKKPGTVPQGWSDGPTGTTPDVIDSVAKKYRDNDMPGGWILPNDGYGCGYTDLQKTVQGLAKYGFRTGLWTENGVAKIAWEVGTAGTRVQKLDVAWTGKGYQFAMDANHSAYDGILNNSDSRPFLWTVMGWAGIQRYAVAWTGDQSGSWDYIRWHIPTLIGSGLSGYAYATGDVDGIFGGSPETYTRDLQWKSFTPVLMGMSGWSANERKHPWAFDEPYRSINRDYLKLKMRLTPYMYGLTREAETSGTPIVRGLMWDNPQDPQALTEAHKYQFLLGRDLLVAPVYRSQAASRGWRRDIHLPTGRWFDYWDGRQVTAGAQGVQIDRQVELKTLPLFVRAGAILPMYPEMLFDGEKPLDEVTFDLYPQGESQYVLYEDDGNTRRYQQGESSEQTITMHAPTDGSGEVRVRIDGVKGQYAGQLSQRRYALRMLSRQRPNAVQLDGRTLPYLPDQKALAAANEGWTFDASARHGTVLVRMPASDIRGTHEVRFDIAVAPAPADDVFPNAPALGRALPADSLVVVNRPAEEPGHKLENAFDDDPGTWFRTVRNQAIHTGAHEWTIGFGERKLIDGIELAPRNDKNWKAGQIRDYEIYMADSNGEWGEPIARGQLKLLQGMQKIEFAPHAGRLLRFRVLSVQDPERDSANNNDPMVLAAQGGSARAVDALQPRDVGPITLSTFHILEHQAADRPEQQRYLSELALPPALAKSVARDHAFGGKSPLVMNGLRFQHGLGVGASSRIDFALDGNWQMLRADLGVDDSCRDAGSLRFQVWSGDRLLYDSGVVKAPGVVKPELDIRGLNRISLRTLGAQSPKVCGNWANAVLIGQQGDKASVSP